MQPTPTDWTTYYQKPFFLSKYTRRMGARQLVALLQRHGVAQGASFLELGGGNSCIFDAFNNAFRPVNYTVADANELGLRLLRERHGAVRVEHCDLLSQSAPEGPFDVVVSLGLIEHFDRAGTRTLIERHFEAAGPSGLVLVTFPTPTVSYRCSRGIAEAVRMWAFPDERPLPVSEVLGACEQWGTVLHSSIGRWTPFTQAVVLARKMARD